MNNRKREYHLLWAKGLFWGLLIALTLLETHSLTTDKFSSYQPTRTNPDLRLTKGFYASHDPITVTNDAELEAISTGGTGTSGDPFIIEGWNITTTTAYGINITGTMKCFIIRNCWIKTTNSIGIYVNNVGIGTATIINNTNSDNDYSIYIDNSRSSIVVNNCCNDNFCGIYLEDSGSSTIANNTCNDNTDGIRIWSSRSLTIANNTCNDNYIDGICIWNSSSSTIANNTCSNNVCGIHLRSSASSTVANNTLHNNGFFISESSKEDFFSNTITDNEVNGLPLGYFENLTTSTITKAYGQLILVNCVSILVKNENYSNASFGITLFFCSECHLINNTCNNGKNGIYIRYSTSMTITNNIGSDNRAYWGSSICLLDSTSSTIANNTCNYGYNGIILLGSTFLTVVNNTCNSNHWGIWVDICNHSTINQNMCKYGKYGIYLLGSDEIVISWNKLTWNDNYGIYLGYDSDDNVIHHNYFINNSGSDAQAYDEGTNNVWYEYLSLEGNYWSDYDRTGSYSIAGSAKVVDPYPFFLSTDTELIASTSETLVASLWFQIVLFIIGISVLFRRRKKVSL